MALGCGEAAAADLNVPAGSPLTAAAPALPALPDLSVPSLTPPPPVGPRAPASAPPLASPAQPAAAPQEATVARQSRIPVESAARAFGNGRNAAGPAPVRVNGSRPRGTRKTARARALRSARGGGNPSRPSRRPDSTVWASRRLVAGPPRERFSRWDLVGGHELGGSHPRDHAPDRALRPSTARAADTKGGHLTRRVRQHTEPANSGSFGGGILVLWMLGNG